MAAEEAVGGSSRGHSALHEILAGTGEAMICICVECSCVAGMPTFYAYLWMSSIDECCLTCTHAKTSVYSKLEQCGTCMTGMTMHALHSEALNTR